MVQSGSLGRIYNMDELNQIRLEQDFTEDQLNQIELDNEIEKDKEANQDRYTDEYVPIKVSPIASFICQRLQTLK